MNTTVKLKTPFFKDVDTNAGSNQILIHRLRPLFEQLHFLADMDLNHRTELLTKVFSAYMGKDTTINDPAKDEVFGLYSEITELFRHIQINQDAVQDIGSDFKELSNSF